MKQLLYSFLLILLASCGSINQSGQLRFVKVDKQEVPIIIKNATLTKHEKEVEKTARLVPTLREENQNLELATIEEFTKEAVESQNQSVDPPQENIKSEREDLDPDEDDENQKIVNQALQAEKHAGNALGLSLAGLIFSILFPLLGIILVSISLSFYSKAKNSRYITPHGEKNLQTSKVILIIDTVILILWILFILFLLSLFIF